jgi:TolB protein
MGSLFTKVGVFLLSAWILLGSFWLKAACAQIVFSSNREGSFHLYLMDSDGKNVRKLTNSPGNNFAPSVSPDGRKIVFVSSRRGADEIYIMDVDGKNEFWFGPYNFFDPAWSLKGDQIACLAAGHRKWAGAHTLVLINVAQWTVTWPSDLPMLGRPAWSPDGTKLAVSSGAIYVINPDGRNAIRLTDEFPGGGAPAWSPDGSQIAFLRDSRDVGKVDVYVMNADGTNLNRLTNHSAWDGSPAWSPDGQTILFVSKRDGNREIYAMNPDGSNLRNLTNHPSDDWYPAWFPNRGAAVSPTGKLATSWSALKRNSQ